MYQIKQVTNLTNLSDLKEWQQLLLPGYTPLLDPPLLLDPTNPQLILIAAYDQLHPVGLLIAKKELNLPLLQIKSLAVKEAHRSEKIELKMIQFLQDLFIQQGGQIIEALYPNEAPYLNQWQQNFIDLRWVGRKLAIIECFYADSQLFQPPWLQHTFRFPKDFTLFFWKDLTSQQKQEIEYKYKTQRIPKEVYPFADNPPFEPLNSLGLSYRGQVVGWVITYPLTSDTLCYSMLYADYELHFKGPIIFLLAHALRLQQQAKIKQALFRVNLVQLSSVRWLHFVKKRLAPYATKYTEFYLAWQSLLSNS